MFHEGVGTSRRRSQGKSPSRHSSRKRGLGALGTVLGLLFASLAHAGEAPPDMGKLIRARLDAYAQRDAALWGSFVDEACFCGGETKASVMRAIANRPAAVKNWFGEIRDLEVRFHGKVSNVAIVHYRVSELTELDSRVNSIDEWRLETHVLRDGRWLLVAGSDDPIPSDPTAIAVPTEVLARYAGRYTYTPGSDDVVTLEGGRLFVQSTGEAKVELFAESETSFFAKGQPYRLVFHFASDGSVDSVAFRQLGQEYVGRRVR